MSPRLPGIRFLLLRSLVRCRRAARRAVCGASYGFGVAAWCLGGMTYSALGWVFSVIAFVVTAAVAACCWIVSGE